MIVFAVLVGIIYWQIDSGETTGIQNSRFKLSITISLVTPALLHDTFFLQEIFLPVKIIDE